MALRRNHYLLLLIIALAVGLRLWQIDQLPPGFHFDEAFEGLEAWRILTDPTYRPLFLLGNFGVTPLNAYANAITFWLVTMVGGEVGPTAMRLTAAAFGVLGVAALYGVADELRRLTTDRWQRSVAFPLFAAATLAIMRWHLHFSRMGIEPIFVPLLWSAAMWLFLRGQRTGSWASFVGSGVLLAGAMYAYQGAWIIPFLMMPVVGWLTVWQWRIQAKGAQRRLWLGAAVSAAAALLVVAPLGWFISQNIDLVLLRPAQLSIVGETTSPADNSVGGAIWATAQMFGPLGAPGDSDPRRNVPGLPALSLWLALPFYAGLLITLRWLAQPAYAIGLIGLIGLLLPGVFSEYAPHFHRVLGAAAPTALICAIGLDWLWQWRPRGMTSVRWVAIVLLCLGGSAESYNYFGRWARLPDLFHAFDVGLWQLGQQITAQPANTSVYLTPRDMEHPTLAFAWATRPGAHQPPVTFDGRHIFPLTAGSTTNNELYAVIEHEDFRTRLLLPGLFPTATIAGEIIDSQGESYARFYQRPSGTTSQRHPQHVLAVTLGDGIALTGYDVQPTPLKPGGVLYLQLYWAVTAPPTADWTVFTHLRKRAADGTMTLVTGQDSRPGNGSLPTLHWQRGWQILDEYQLMLPADLVPGDYTLAIGLYQPNGERLPATADGLYLGEVSIEE